MSTLTIARAAQADAVHAYLRNVGRSANALLAALLAVPSREPATVAAAEDRSESAERGSLSRLYKLAGGYDSVMPSLAQELRYIARR